MLQNKYYLKHEHERFIIIDNKAQGAAERFILSDKARIASVLLDSFKNDPFYTHFVTLFTKELSIFQRQKLCKNLCVFYHIKTPSRL